MSVQSNTCRHRYVTVRVEKTAILHARYGLCRREHKQCKLCGDKIIDHLLVDIDGKGILSPFFNLEAK